MKINTEILKEDLELAKQIAITAFGKDEPSIVASVMNGITAQRVGADLDANLAHLASEICRAAAVAAGG